MKRKKDSGFVERRLNGKNMQVFSRDDAAEQIRTARRAGWNVQRLEGGARIHATPRGGDYGYRKFFVDWDIFQEETETIVWQELHDGSFEYIAGADVYCAGKACGRSVRDGLAWVAARWDGLRWHAIGNNCYHSRIQAMQACSRSMGKGNGRHTLIRYKLILDNVEYQAHA